MKLKNVGTAAAVLLTSIVLSAFAFEQPQQKEEKPKNLKVLKKDIGHEELITTMRSFNAALGVKCGFCHAADKNNPKDMDFASDENHHKEIARSMMKMTQRINKKYFNRTDREGQVKSISCNTCHNGQKEPVMLSAN